MHFGTKSYLKSICNHTAKHTLNTFKTQFWKSYFYMLFVMLRFYSIYFCKQEVRRKRAKREREKRIVVHQWRASPFNHMPLRSHRCAALPLLLHCLLCSPLFCNVNSGEWPTSSISTIPRFIIVALLFPFSLLSSE